MPALYALGQHPAPFQAHRELRPGEDLHAFLDDVYVTCTPDRTGPGRASFGAAVVLWKKAAAHVCREAGARVTCNTRLADMSLHVERVDGRRLQTVGGSAARG